MSQSSLPQRNPPSELQPPFETQTHLLGPDQVTVDPDLVQTAVDVGVAAGGEREGGRGAREAAPHLLHVSTVVVVDDPLDPLPVLEPVFGHGLLEPPGPGLDSGPDRALGFSPVSGLDSVHEDGPAAFGRRLGFGADLWTWLFIL